MIINPTWEAYFAADTQNVKTGRYNKGIIYSRMPAAGVRRITAKVKTVICEQAPNHGSYFAYARLIARVTFELCQHLIQLLTEVCLGHGTAEGYGGLSVLEHDEMRDAYHTVLLRDRHIFIHVEFADLHLAGVSFGTFLYHRSHHLAGTTPVSIEIHQNGNLRMQNFLFKISNSKSVFHNDPSFPRLNASSRYGLSFYNYSESHSPYKTSYLLERKHSQIIVLYGTEQLQVFQKNQCVMNYFKKTSVL